MLQERVVTPLGNHKTFRVDVRVLAATNCDLEQLVAGGHFREDLYYRLNVVAIKTIPLRDRPEDIAPLTHFFLEKIAGRLGPPARDLSPHCSDCMLRHDWPGNVRELENFLEQAVLLSAEKTIRPDSLPVVAKPSASVRLGQSLGPRHGGSCVPPSDDRARPRRPPRRMPQKGTDLGRRWTNSSAIISSGRWSGRTTTSAAAADLLGMHYQQLLRKIKKFGLDNSASRPGRRKKSP